MVAGRFAALLMKVTSSALFWVGVLQRGIFMPFGLNGNASRQGKAESLVMLFALLVFLGGALLCIRLVHAGQISDQSPVVHSRKKSGPFARAVRCLLSLPLYASSRN